MNTSAYYTWKLTLPNLQQDLLDGYAVPGTCIEGTLVKGMT